MSAPVLTSSDLREIAKALDEFERVMVDKEGNPRARYSLLGDVEVYQPGTVDVLGHFVWEDGSWVGFRFAGDPE